MRFSKVVLIVAVAALIIAPAAFSIAFTDASYFPPVGVTGQSYHHKFEIRAGGGCPPYQYKILSGSLPPGLTLVTEGKQSGDVNGTPTTAGEYTFYLDGFDTPAACGDPLRAPDHTQRQFTITIQQGLQIQQRQSTLTPAQVGTPYSQQFTANASDASWTVSGGALPAGVTLSSGGLLSGSPTTAGDYSFKVTASSGGRSDSQTYTLSVVSKLQLSARATAAEVGHAVTIKPQATGGKPGYTFAAEGTLPAGLTLNAATGEITGTPTAAGTYPLKLRVTDSIGLTTTVDVPLKVSAKLSIARKALRAAKVGQLYRAKLTALGGVGPFTWNILGGRPGFLPKGIAFNKRTGTFAGTPTKAGVYRLRLQVVDSLGVRSALGIVLTVKA
jgi:large repetitive protein